jgi:hypothetical protein
MKTKNSTLLVILLVAIIAVGLYFVFNSRQSTQPTATPTDSPTTQTSSTKQITNLSDLPEFNRSLADVENEHTWSVATTKTGVTLTYPTKGKYAPTWTYALLANDDSHLQGMCYVTESIVYKQTENPGYENSCQTTTALNAGPGTRTDYFVFQNGYIDNNDKMITQTHLFTFTKTYPEGFDMNTYSAVLNKVINIID